jgi:hypothetical protein
VRFTPHKRISGPATRLLAHMLYFCNKLVLGEPKRVDGLRRHLVGHARMRGGDARFRRKRP